MMFQKIKRISLLTVLFVLNGCTCERGDDSDRARMSEAEKTGKKVFYMPRYEAYRSLDPMKQFDESSSEILQNVYDRLFEYHYLKRPYQMVPSLLEKMPEKQKDGVTYIFELRKGVYFNNDDCFEKGQGRELTADDVVYTLKRFSDANVNALSYSLMSGFVVGMDQFREKSKKLGKGFKYEGNEIEGVSKVGKYTFKIQFTRDNPVALYPFAMTQLSIIPREAVDKYGDEFERHPVGTGPFYIEKLDRRADIVLKKNNNYFGTYPTEGEADDLASGLLEAAGKKLPFVDEVVMPLIEEAQPAILSFQKGDIDFVRIDRDSFTKFLERQDGDLKLRPEYDGKWYMFAAEGLNMDYLRFNMKDPIVGGTSEQQVALRKAIASALDLPGFIALIYNGRAKELQTIVPHPIYGSERFVTSQFYGYDVKKAKEYLAQAGYPNGKGLPELTVEYRSAASQFRQAWEYHRAKLAAVGIKVKGNFQTFSSFLKKTDSGNFQISAGGWLADYPDPENFFALLYGPNESPGPNHGYYKSEKYDRLFEKMRFMHNGPERLAVIEEMNEVLKNDVPMIYLYSVKRVGMYHKWLKNIKRNVLVHPPLKFADIDLKQKAKGF